MSFIVFEVKQDDFSPMIKEFDNEELAKKYLEHEGYSTPVEGEVTMVSNCNGGNTERVTYKRSERNMHTAFIYKTQ